MRNTTYPVKGSSSRIVLVTGATGYVGGRLIPELLSAGYRVRCLVRDAARIPDKAWREHVEVVEGDVLDRSTLGPALKGVWAAYYLVHSMGSASEDLVSVEVRAATNFSEEAKAHGVDRLIYLGGIEPSSGTLSKHLKSRIETGNALRSSGIAVTEFRAGVIVGSGSLSFELIRYLTERVPLLITPKWVKTRTQPIAVRDVLAYLVQALSVPESRDRIIEIGGSEIMSYADMFSVYAELRGLKRPILQVPVLTPRLSSLWVGLVTPINTQIARQLIDGLDNEVLVTDETAARMFDIEPSGYATAASRALQRFESDQVETYWSGSVSSSLSDNQVYSTLGESENMMKETHRLVVGCTPSDAYEVVSSLGGDTGWLYADFLWRIRGVIDLMAGGIGMRKSRRSPSRLQPGDTIDFWRVEKVEKDAYLLLRAEMKLPGLAWLEFAMTEQEPGRTTITQRAYYEPRGLPGLLYWYLFSIPHRFIFPGMLKRIGSLASERHDARKGG